MSSMNGVLSPPMILDSVASSMNLSSKRKRENNVPDSECSAPPEMPHAESQALIKDLIEILQVDDPTPSVLTRTIPDLPRSSGPISKRPKAGEARESRTSISYRISSDYYTTVDEVLDDIDVAVNEIVDKLDLSNVVGQNQCTTNPRAPSELSIKIMAFSKRAHELVKREKASWERTHKTNNNGTTQDYVRFPGQDQYPLPSSSTQDNRLVLTLFGNAPTPKQLFSSLQQLIKANGCEEGVAFPIREIALPNGVATTRIISTYPPSGTESRKRPQTLGEVFPTPPNVVPSIPPKMSAEATTKSSTVGWYDPVSLRKSSNSLSYFDQGISLGQWIDYSKISDSVRGYRTKNKDKVLDFAVNSYSSTDKDVSDSEAERLETLFRSAYSSFAPTKDDAAAIAPTGCLDQVWWHEIGIKSFNNLIQCSNGEIDEEMTTSLSKKSLNDDLIIFEKGLEDLEKNPIDPNLNELQFETDKAIHDKEIDEVLEEITELLEVLTSYQKIRHLSNISNRSTSLYSSPDSKSLATPSRPSESEISTYEILKSQLSLMIASLPPYAVAKINSDRLAELSISTKIEVQLNDYKGVMEEDDSSIRHKTTASVNSAISSPRPSTQSLHRSVNSNPSSHYGNHISSPQSRGPTAQYYNSVQPPVRTPQINNQRPQATMPGPYQAQRTSNTVPFRPSSYGTSYPHQPARSSQPHVPYTQTPVSQGYLRAPSQTHHHQHGPQSVVQTIASNKYSSQSSYQSQPQVQSSPNGIDYSRQSSSQQPPRQASPQSTGYSPKTIASHPQVSQFTGS